MDLCSLAFKLSRKITPKLLVIIIQVFFHVQLPFHFPATEIASSKYLFRSEGAGSWDLKAHCEVDCSFRYRLWMASVVLSLVEMEAWAAVSQQGYGKPPPVRTCGCYTSTCRAKTNLLWMLTPEFQLLNSFWYGYINIFKFISTSRWMGSSCSCLHVFCIWSVSCGG